MARYAPLQILPASEVPQSERDHLFRPGRLSSVLAFVFFSALAAGGLGWPWLAPALGFEQTLPTWLTSLIGAAVLLFVWIAWRCQPPSRRLAAAGRLRRALPALRFAPQLRASGRGPHGGLHPQG